jgi:putative ABC transport system ATP-binding protein
MIKTKNLTKKYKSGAGEITALNSVDFHVPRGQFVAVTGKSGSGKSTLLYQLGLLDVPTHGEISIDGLDVLSLDQNERTYFRLVELGYVFQDYAILPSLTALENVMVPLLMRGTKKDAARKKAEFALERVGLAEKFGSLPGQLSGGQQQRVSIARAIGHDPKIIFADEPTANLDSETSKVILDVFLKLHKEGQTIIMVTHEPEYASITNRIIELSDGQLVGDVPIIGESGHEHKI